MRTQPDFNQLAKEIFEQNKAVGWWDDMNRCIFQTLQLVSTEIAEATEGERKNLMDDKLPHRRMGEVELADALIRTLDFGGRYELVHSDSAAARRYLGPDIIAIPTVAGRHLMLNMVLSNLSKHYMSEHLDGRGRDMAKRRCAKEGCYAPDDFCLELASPLHEQCQFFVKTEATEAPAKVPSDVSLAYTHLIESFCIVADLQSYDIIGAMYEKLEYNKQREDHKRENRAKENGKKF